MTPTHATNLRHLAIPGIAFPQCILVGGNALDERDYRGWSRLSDDSTSRLADVQHDALQQRFHRMLVAWQ